jgi:hypothetical protein
VQDFSGDLEGFLLTKHVGSIENSVFSLPIRRHPSCIHIIFRLTIELPNNARKAFLLCNDTKLQQPG